MLWHPIRTWGGVFELQFFPIRGVFERELQIYVGNLTWPKRQIPGGMPGGDVKVSIDSRITGELPLVKSACPC